MQSGANNVFRRFLLEPPTVLGTLWSALRGVMSVAVNLEDRTAMEAMIQKGIIRDTVLQNSSHHGVASPGGSGAVLAFSLFDSLQHNPLWNKYGFDALEFRQAVGPALTNMHDVLFQLQHRETMRKRELTDEDSEAKGKDGKISSDDDADGKVTMKDLNVATPQELFGALFQNFFGENTWKKEAEDDPESLAGSLSKMTTPPFFDHLFHATKLELPGLDNKVTLEDDGVIVLSSDYVTGSCKVGQVAILRARAETVEEERDNNEERFEEFKASDPDYEHKQQNPKHVAAQLDVLFEISVRFQETLLSMEKANALAEKADNKDDAKSIAALEQHAEDAGEKHIVQYTRLGVAVLEGFLQGGKLDEGRLRWRVPLLREPVEFASDDIVRTVLPNDSGSDDKDNSEKETESSSSKSQTPPSS